MKPLLALVLVLWPALAPAQTRGAYEATQHGRVLSCYAEAYSLVELVDVATKNLYMVAQEDRKSTRLNSSHVSESRMPSSA